MKKTYVLALLLAGVFALNTAHAQTHNKLGLGVIVGEPTGLSVKKWLDSRRALDLGLGWSSSGRNSLHLHGDYLFHQDGLLEGISRELSLSGRLTTYVGLGARARFKDDNKGKGNDEEKDKDRFGVRVPLGISYLFADAPVDLFIEAVPTLDLIPDSDFSIKLALGARYYF